MIPFCGAPNGEAIAHDIKKFHPSVFLVGTDSNDWANNRWLYDRFVVVPEVSDSKYISIVQATAKSCKWIFPLNSMDAAKLQKSKVLNGSRDGVNKVLASSPDVILEASNKAALYDRFGIPYKVATGQSMLLRLNQMGVDKRGLVVKPLGGRGTRGVFIIKKIDDFIARNEFKPGFLYVSYPRFLNMFTASKWFNDSSKKWVVMPYYTGNEYFVNCLCKDGEVLWSQVLHVKDKRDHVCTMASVVRHPSNLAMAKHICKEYGFNYWVNIQFIDDHLIEVNPRISSFVASNDYSVPYLAVRLAEGEVVNEKRFPPPPIGSTLQRVFQSYYLGI